jgi:threonine/homoserine/homoserine lactone efflux protein
VLWDVVGALLPSAAGIALSPFPVVGAILVVGGPHGRWAGPAFVAGWLAGLSALTAVAVALGSLVGNGEGATWMSWVRILLGLVLMALGLRKFLGRPRGDEGAVTPRWMAGIVTASPRRALVVGASLAALNPKNLAFALASASVIGQLDQAADQAFVEGVIFVTLASSTVLGVVLVSQLGGDRGQRALAALQHRLVANNDVIVSVVLLLIGATILGDGLSAAG